MIASVNTWRDGGHANAKFFVSIQRARYNNFSILLLFVCAFFIVATPGRSDALSISGDPAFLQNYSSLPMVAAGVQDPYDGPCFVWNGKGGSARHDTWWSHCKWTRVPSHSFRGPWRNVDAFTTPRGRYRVRFGGGGWITLDHGTWTKIRDDQWAQCLNGPVGPDCTIRSSI
jgi:hypothetical protein